MVIPCIVFIKHYMPGTKLSNLHPELPPCHHLLSPSLALVPLPCFLPNSLDAVQRSVPASLPALLLCSLLQSQLYGGECLPLVGAFFSDPEPHSACFPHVDRAKQASRAPELGEGWLCSMVMSNFMASEIKFSTL